MLEVNNRRTPSPHWFFSFIFPSTFLQLPSEVFFQSKELYNITDAIYLCLSFLRQGLTVELWLALNSLGKPYLP